MVAPILTRTFWRAALRSPSFPAWLQFISVLIAILALAADYQERKRDTFSETARQTLSIINQYYSRTDVENDRIEWGRLKDETERKNYVLTRGEKIWRNLQHMTLTYSLLITCLRDELCDPETARSLMCLSAEADFEYIQYIRKNVDYPIPYGIDYFYSTYCRDWVEQIDAVMRQTVGD